MDTDRHNYVVQCPAAWIQIDIQIDIQIYRQGPCDIDTDGHNYLLVECCFTSTETVGLLGTGALDVHLDFHTPPEL